MLLHLLNNFKIQNYYLNKPRFNGVYSRDYLPDEIQDEVNAINLDEYSDIGTHQIALYPVNNNVTYFDSFGLGHIPKEIDSVMCGYFCIGFINFMLESKTLTDFPNLFSPNN